MILAMLEAFSDMASLLGMFAGSLAISLALYIQVIKRYPITIPYTLAMYVLGAFLLIINLDLDTPIHTPVGLKLAVACAYLSVIAVEVALFYDVRTRYSRFVSFIEKLQNTWEADE